LTSSAATSVAATRQQRSETMTAVCMRQGEE
jgi:hypothetical protein